MYDHKTRLNNRQKLFTKLQYEQLIANGRKRDQNHPPVVKLFGGACFTWLLSEIDPDQPEIAFGLCDLGQGTPELGSVSLAEILALRFPPFRLPAERDLHFKAKGRRMSEFTDKTSLVGVA